MVKTVARKMEGRIKTLSGAEISKDLTTFTLHVAMIINEICPDKNGSLSMKKVMKSIRKKFGIENRDDWNHIRVFIRNRVLVTVENMERWYGL